MPTHFAWSDSAIYLVNCRSLGLSIEALCFGVDKCHGRLAGSESYLVFVVHQCMPKCLLSLGIG